MRCAVNGTHTVLYDQIFKLGPTSNNKQYKALARSKIEEDNKTLLSRIHSARTVYGLKKYQEHKLLHDKYKENIRNRYGSTND